MSEVKWIKITTNIFDDEKIRLIDSMPDNDTIIVIWFKLLILAGKSNNEGVLALSDKLYYTDEMLATIFNRKLSTVKLALETFEKLGMIESGNFIYIKNWEKYQSIDKLKQIKTQQNERQQLRYYRTKLKELGIDIESPGIPNTAEEIKSYYQDIKSGKNLTLFSRDTHAIDIDKEIDIELEIKEKEYKKKSKVSNETTHFIKPTVQEIENYIKEKSYSIDPNHFYDYYEARNWELSKGRKMKDWKATVRTWVHKQKEFDKINQEKGKRNEKFETKWLDDYIEKL